MKKKLALGAITAALLIVGATTAFAETDVPKAAERQYQQLNTQAIENTQPQGCYGPQCGTSPNGSSANPGATNTNYNS